MTPTPTMERDSLVARLERVRHKKRGSEYEVLGVGKMQAADWRIPGWNDAWQTETFSTRADMSDVTIYRSVDDGSLWVRPREEFEDGRFERLEAALHPAPEAASAGAAGETFQNRVQPWMMACFGPEISGDRVERGDRLLEEVFELLQSGGYDPARVLALRDYVWGREKGEPVQEVGGVMVTLAAYCLAHELDMHEAGETELARIWTKVEKIKAKQAAKPVGSALPVAPSDTAPPPKGAQEEEVIAAAKKIAAWIGYSWEGLNGPGRITDKGFPVWIHGSQFGGMAFQGYQGDLKDLARDLLAPSPKGVSDGVREALRKAAQLADRATDWNLYEVEIDGEMVSVYDLAAEFHAVSQEPSPATAEERAASKEGA